MSILLLMLLLYGIKHNYLFILTWLLICRLCHYLMNVRCKGWTRKFDYPNFSINRIMQTGEAFLTHHTTQLSIPFYIHNVSYHFLCFVI
jgi:hypothetical protein